ncbi:hypothetical protein ACFQL4_20820 [Halosimplex aquaticum]
MLSNAVQSFRYAFRRELLALYAAVVVGQWIMDLSNVVLAVVPFLPRFVRRVLSWPIFLLGSRWSSAASSASSIASYPMPGNAGGTVWSGTAKVFRRGCRTGHE